MFDLDEKILRAYFKMEEAQRQRLWMQRIWHPETFNWKDKSGPLPITRSTAIKYEEFEKMGFGPEYCERMKTLEENARQELMDFAAEHALWPHFSRINGLSRYTCGAFIAAGGDISRAPTVSAFWKGMGLDILNNGIYARNGKMIQPPGSAPRRIRGNTDVERKIPALPHVTKIGEQIRQQIVRFSSRSKIGGHYVRFRAMVDAKNPERAKVFNFKDAERRTQKLLYACLWKQWRIAYRLPAPDAYAFDILKHPGDHIIEMSDLYDVDAAA